MFWRIMYTDITNGRRRCRFRREINALAAFIADSPTVDAVETEDAVKAAILVLEDNIDLYRGGRYVLVGSTWEVERYPSTDAYQCRKARWLNSVLQKS